MIIERRKKESEKQRRLEPRGPTLPATNSEKEKKNEEKEEEREGEVVSSILNGGLLDFKSHKIKKIAIKRREQRRKRT